MQTITFEVENNFSFLHVKIRGENNISYNLFSENLPLVEYLIILMVLHLYDRSMV